MLAQRHPHHGGAVAVGGGGVEAVRRELPDDIALQCPEVGAAVAGEDRLEARMAGVILSA